MFADVDALAAAINWVVPALVGTVFTLFGCIKLYGYVSGVVGGAEKPLATRLCGT